MVAYDFLVTFEDGAREWYTFISYGIMDAYEMVYSLTSTMNRRISTISVSVADD